MSASRPRTKRKADRQRRSEVTHRPREKAKTAPDRGTQAVPTNSNRMITSAAKPAHAAMAPDVMPILDLMELNARTGA